MRSLDEFTGYRQVFKDANTLPPFFEANLVDPSRIVKIFQNDPQAQIRIFYYQYLKLCFELENVDYDMFIRKTEEIINNPQFQFIFYPNDDLSIYNDTQAKSLIMQFFGVLGEGNNNVLQSLTKYPIMDKILIHFFRSLILLSNVSDSLDAYIQRQKLLNFLCQTFDVQVNIYGQCIKYADTDIFVYQLNQNAVYMAYMDYENYNNSAEQSPQVAYKQEATYEEERKVPVTNAYNNQGYSAVVNRPQSNRKEALAKDSYIADQFMDFTSNANALSAKAKIIVQQQHIEPPKPKAEIQKPIQKPQLVPTIPKQAPKLDNLQVKQDYSRNVNSSLVEVRSIPPQSSSFIYKPQSKLDLLQPSANPFPLAYTTQTIQSSESSFKYSTNNLPNFPKITQQPTKDNVFNQIQKSYQPQLPIQPSQLPIQPPQLPVQPQLSQYSISNNKQIKNDLIYNPKLQNPSFSITSYLPPKVQEFPKDIKSVTTNTALSKKKPSGLNISQQYTSSQISKYMVQPHRSNVENIKSRQRNVRSSIMNQIK